MEHRKLVLVSYNSSNKVVKLPAVESSEELSYLVKECKKMFKFGANVNFNVTFQHYDPVWDAYVDIDQDYVLEERDKLNMIVLPLLTDSTSIASTSIASSVSKDNDVCMYVCMYVCMCMYVCSLEIFYLMLTYRCFCLLEKLCSDVHVSNYCMYYLCTVYVYCNVQSVLSVLSA